MGKRAKSIESQIELLRRRGMRVDGPRRAAGFVLEIGWYRLSLYWFPFEIRYPNPMDDGHRFRPGTRFEDALSLYAFDFRMRHMLLPALERVETAFRTFVIYTVSNRYPDSPYWFADPAVVEPHQARNFERSIYQPMRRLNDDIRLHHRRFPRDKLAPAWKTLEFMTFGGMLTLFDSLNSQPLKAEISQHFGVRDPNIFLNYLEALLALRNSCAHGNVLYSFHTPSPLRPGPADTPHGRNLGATLKTLCWLLQQISPRVAKETRHNARDLKAQFAVSPLVADVLAHISGL